jgi:N-acetylglucosamine-6-phosphate deacetylase
MPKQKTLVNKLINSVEDKVKSTLKATHNFNAVSVIVERSKPLEGFATADDKVWYSFKIDGDRVTFGS